VLREEDRRHAVEGVAGFVEDIEVTGVACFLVNHVGDFLDDALTHPRRLLLEHLTMGAGVLFDVALALLRLGQLLLHRLLLLLLYFSRVLGFLRILSELVEFLDLLAVLRDHFLLLLGVTVGGFLQLAGGDGRLVVLVKYAIEIDRDDASRGCLGQRRRSQRRGGDRNGCHYVHLHIWFEPFFRSLSLCAQYIRTGSQR